MTNASQSTVRVPPWSTTWEAVGLIARGYTVRTCTRIALVVGTVLAIVNQSAVVIAGDANTMTAVRVGFNFLVPFVVSSVGYLAPFRVRRAGDHA